MFEEDFSSSSSSDDEGELLDSSDNENEQCGLIHRLSSHDTDSSSEEHTPKGSGSSSTRRIQVGCYEPGHGHRQQGLQQRQQQQQQKPRELSSEQIQLVVRRLHRRQQMVRGSRYRQHAREAKEQQAARKQRRAEHQHKEEERRQAELQRAQRRAFNEQCGHLLQSLNAPSAPVAAAVVVLDSLSAAQQLDRVPAPPAHKAEGPISPRVAAACTATHSSSHSSNKGSPSSSSTCRSSSSSTSKHSTLSEEQEWALKQQAKQARLLQQQVQQQPSWYQPGARAYEQREARRQAQAEDRQKQRDSSRSQQGPSAVAYLLTSLLSKNSRPGPQSTSTPTPTPSTSPPQPSPQRSCKAPNRMLRPVKEGQEAEWIAADVLREQHKQAAAEAQAAERARVLEEIRKWREAEQLAAERQRAAVQARRQAQEEEQREIALHGSFKAAFRRSSRKLRTLVRSLSSK